MTRLKAVWAIRRENYGEPSASARCALLFARYKNFIDGPRVEGRERPREGSARNSSPPAKPGTHAAMREINGLTIHQRASSHDARYTRSRALLRCRRRHTALSKRAVEPDTPEVPGGSLPNDLLRDAGVRGDNQAIELTGYAGKIWITLRAFDFRGVGVDRKHFVTGLAQFAVHRVRRASRPARYASDGDALSTEKVRNKRRHLRHGRLLGQIQPQCTVDSKHTGRIPGSAEFSQGSGRISEGPWNLQENLVMELPRRFAGGFSEER
jgi:hypothetical protein